MDVSQSYNFIYSIMIKTDILLKWLTICANLAILIGLIFVSLELRQNNDALKLQSQDAISDGFVQLNLASISDSSVARLWVVGLYEPESLTNVEAVQFSFYLRGVFNQLFRIHSLYETGTLSELEWADYAKEAAYLMSTKGGQLYFENNWVRDSFLEELSKFKGARPNIDFRLGRESLPN